MCFCFLVFSADFCSLNSLVYLNRLPLTNMSADISLWYNSSTQNYIFPKAAFLNCKFYCTFLMFSVPKTCHRSSSLLQQNYWTASCKSCYVFNQAATGFTATSTFAFPPVRKPLSSLAVMAADEVTVMSRL